VCPNCRAVHFPYAHCSVSTRFELGMPVLQHVPGRPPRRRPRTVTGPQSESVSLRLAETIIVMIITMDSTRPVTAW
jgi:hypothetical protein